MTAGRVLGLLLAVAVIAWLLPTATSVLRPGSPRAGIPGSAEKAPAQRAREAAQASEAVRAQTEAVSRATDSQDGGKLTSVSENMTPDQIRSLIGPPDSVDTETTENGIVREKWTYRRVGKTIVFENGIVVRVE
jgi:hypothetical protein